MAVEIDESKLSTMGMEELQKLEDAVAADEAGAAAPEVPAAPQQPAVASETVPPVPAASATPAAAVPPAEPSAAPAPAPAEDLAKHIAPPSKWAAERHEKRQLRMQLEETAAKAQKADQLEGDLNTLKAEMDQLRQTLQDKGVVSLPKDPTANLTPEKIEAIRDEFGDELADMFTATVAVLKQQAAPSTATAPAAPAPAQAPAEGVDPELLKAIDANDELSYWQENSPALWSRAVAKDSQLLADPAYAQLPYADRFAKVVEAVKTDVTTATTGAPTQMAGIPASLTGAAGVAPPAAGNTALDQMQAIADPAKQMAFYNAQPQKVRDQVDIALNI